MKCSHPVRRWSVPLILAAVLITATAGAPAQDVQGATVEGQRLMAERLADLARAALARRPPAQVAQVEQVEQAAQVEQAVILLRRATEIAPDNEELWRLRVEAVGMTDDRDELIGALKGYLRCAPADDVAQYQLIRVLLDRQQTVEQRIGFLTRIADSSESRRFTRSLRSRAAFDAALLAREQGDRAAYGRLLSLALALDSTNKRAAFEAYAELAGRDAPMDEIAAAMFTLFSADPTDPRAHVAIADMLLGVGLYEQAAGWYETSGQLGRAAGEPAGLDIASRWARALWGAGRIDEALAMVGQIEHLYDAPRSPDEASANGEEAPADDADEPALPPKRVDGAPEVWPPLDLQMLRLAMLVSSGNAPQAQSACAQLAAHYGQQIAEASAEDRAAAIAGLVWARLLAEQELGKVADRLAELEPIVGAEDERLTVLRGWLAVRQGKAELAEKLLQPLAERDVKAAYGLARARMALDQPDKVAALLRSIHQRAAGDMFGLMAASDGKRLEVDLSPPSAVRPVGLMFENIPEELRRIAGRAEDFVLLRASPVGPTFAYGQPIDLTLKLQNVSRIPLGLGPDHAVPVRVAIIPSVRLSGQDGPNLRPVVVDLHRRLRLDAGRIVEVTIRMDSGDLGTVLDRSPLALADLRAVVVLSPRLGPNGLLVPGVLGSRAKVRGVNRRNWVFSETNFDNTLAQAGSSDAGDAMRASALLINLVGYLNEETAEQKSRLVRTLSTAFERMPAMQRAFVVSHIHRGDTVQEAMKPVLDLACRDDSELVQMMLVVTQVDQVDSPILNTALRSRSSDLRRLAQAERTRLLEAAETEDEADE